MTEKEKYVTPNPVRITHVNKMKTLHGKPYIGMFSGALPHPVVSLAPFQYHMLSKVGIDPNQITDEETYCSLLVWWEETGKKKKGGNPYISATHIEVDVHDPVLEELRVIKFLLTVMAEQAVGGHEALMQIWRERYESGAQHTQQPKSQQSAAQPKNGGDNGESPAPTKPIGKKGEKKAGNKGPKPAIRVGDTVKAQGKTAAREGKVITIVDGGKISVKFADGSVYGFSPDKVTLVDF